MADAWVLYSHDLQNLIPLSTTRQPQQLGHYIDFLVHMAIDLHAMRMKPLLRLNRSGDCFIPLGT